MDIKKAIRKFYEENSAVVDEAFKTGNLAEINELVRLGVKKVIEEFDYTEYFFETKRVGLGDTAVAELEDPVRADVYALAPGGSVIYSNVSNTNYYPISAVPITAAYAVNKLESRNSALPALEDMVAQLSRQMKVEIQKHALSLVKAATVGDFLKNTTKNDLEATLEEVLNRVFDSIETDAEVYIIGRRPALSVISKLENASEVWKAEREKEGFVSYYLGAEIKEVRAVGPKREHILDENEFYVISPQCGKFVYFGDVQKGSHNPDMWVEEIGLLQFVGGVVVPSLGRVYRVVITDL